MQPVIALALLALCLALDLMWGTAAVLSAALPAAANALVVAKQYEMFVEGASSTIPVSALALVATISALPLPVGNSRHFEEASPSRPHSRRSGNGRDQRDGTA